MYERPSMCSKWITPKISSLASIHCVGPWPRPNLSHHLRTDEPHLQTREQFSLLCDRSEHFAKSVRPSWADSVGQMSSDRIDSGRGHLPDNCRACCSGCNRAKNSMDVQCSPASTGGNRSSVSYSGQRLWGVRLQGQQGVAVGGGAFLGAVTDALWPRPGSRGASRGPSLAGVGLRPPGRRQRGCAC